MKLNWKKYPKQQPKKVGRYIIWAKHKRESLSCPYLDIALYTPERGWNISSRREVTHWAERTEIESPEDGYEPIRVLTVQDYSDLRQADYEDMRNEGKL